MVKLNLNEPVKFFLTTAGQATLKCHDLEVKRRVEAALKRPFPQELHERGPDGSYRMQLHEVMNIFGPDTILGVESPFVDNEIEVVE